jgi:hypothetical protein
MLLKTDVRETVPGVRIRLPPPLLLLSDSCELVIPCTNSELDWGLSPVANTQFPEVKLTKQIQTANRLRY